MVSSNDNTVVIDRFVEGFAERYSKCIEEGNEVYVSSPDAVYEISMTIMNIETILRMQLVSDNVKGYVFEEFIALYPFVVVDLG